MTLMPMHMPKSILTLMPMITPNSILTRQKWSLPRLRLSLSLRLIPMLMRIPMRMLSQMTTHSSMPRPPERDWSTRTPLVNKLLMV